MVVGCVMSCGVVVSGRYLVVGTSPSPSGHGVCPFGCLFVSSRGAIGMLIVGL